MNEARLRTALLCLFSVINVNAGRVCISFYNYNMSTRPFWLITFTSLNEHSRLMFMEYVDDDNQILINGDQRWHILKNSKNFG